MATAERAWRLLVALPVVAAVVAGAVAASHAGTGTGSGSSSADPTTVEPLAVEATSVYDFRDLAELVHAADLVVRGRVVATARGRVVGDPGTAVVSRVVTVEVAEVLAGTAAPATVLVEEEGWLADGTPIEVNGLAPSRDGLDAIWFLDELASADLPAYLVINHQGRYDVDGGSLHGAAADDELIGRLASLGADGLTAEVRRLAAGS